MSRNKAWTNPVKLMFHLPSVRLFSALCCLLILSPAVAKETDSLDEIRAVQQQLRNLPLADLMNLTVTSVIKQAQTLAESAAAVFVLTQNDIRRSGATSIPEALRMVPGVHVARIDASQWSVTARGFSGRYANKLLVLIDGRSVYTPIFGGVDWDEQDLLLEDIERIEVIRGPGGSLWGVNAVNGIINILTRAAVDTQGGQLIAGAGSEMRAFGSARFGGSVGDSAHYRAYIKGIEHDKSVPAQQQLPITDGWRMHSGGFKLDWQVSDADFWTLDGRLFSGDIGQTLFTFALEPNAPQYLSQSYTVDGGHLLSRWRHTWSPSSEHQLQLYYNRSRRADALFGNQVNTFDVDFQHHFMPMDVQTLTWGLGYRRIDSKATAGIRASATPAHRNQDLYSAFLQSEWRLLDDRLTFTLGSKFVHTFFTGWEIQPSAKLLWRIDPQHIVWGSVSRAVRTPSVGERDFDGLSEIRTTPEGVPVFFTWRADDQFDSERLLSYELGFRFLPAAAFSVDIAAYYTVYDKLRSFSFDPLEVKLSPIAHLEQPTHFTNRTTGESYGIELSGHWSPYASVHLGLAYTWTQLDLRLIQNTAPSVLFSNRIDQASLADETQTPQHQVSLRSSFDLPYNTELDLWLRYTDRVRQEVSQGNVKGYFSLDVRLAWQASQALEFSVVGQDLLDKSHREFPLELITTVPSEQQRSVYFKMDWRF